MSGRHLSSDDLHEIKRVCATLFGAPADAFRPWLPLAPYTRTPDGLDHIIVVCSAECEGSLPLLDGAEIRFSHPNTPPGWPGAGHDRIDSVIFIYHGRTLLELPHPKT